MSVPAHILTILYKNPLPLILSSHTSSSFIEAVKLYISLTVDFMHAFPSARQNAIEDEDTYAEDVELLTEFWQKTPFTQDTTLLCGFMKDKDYKKMLALLCPHFKNIIVTVPPSPRGAGEESIRAALPKKAQIVFEPDWKKALMSAKKYPRVLCTGSFYLAGAVRGKLRL